MVADNQAVFLSGHGRVEVRASDFPALALGNRKLRHGVVIRVLAAGVCEADRALAARPSPPRLPAGHQAVGEVVELGRDVEFVKLGDLVSVPFNVSCGRCRHCRSLDTDACLHVNPLATGAVYGSGDGGGWPGLQAEFAAVPYADWNLLAFRDRERALAYLADLALLSDLFPVAFEAAVRAGVRDGSSVYLAGVTSLGLACAVACRQLGAAAVLAGDTRPERLEQAAKLGCEVVDLARGGTLAEQVEQALGTPEVDAVVDCLAFAARGHAAGGAPHPAPAAAEVAPARGHGVAAGPCAVLRHHDLLARAVLDGGTRIAEAVNAVPVPLAHAPAAYRGDGDGTVRTWLLDPHDLLASVAR